ncbi:MAG TPA: type II toxin-antitoxin system RelE/ParE family toxin [Longimicrobium sp.]|jgi:plasmid stabilization system protein ParE|nr:type II toxin-antitoxin system RelE/ParE family toxin [Longimicrobium sp.]
MAAARRELRRAVDWYDGEAPGLGDELVAEVDRTLKDIVEYPDAGSPHLAGTRRLLTRRFPYSIIYQVRGDEIVVIAVAHQRRKPDFWLRRL